jgi:mannose-6-phosphate isomerase-like protein (cupin superfamily)
VQIVSNTGVYSAPAQNRFVEHLRASKLSTGTYSLPAVGVDDQEPHREDEVYFVTAGRARIIIESGQANVSPGDLFYISAGEAHRFVDISEKLALLVVLSPPYTGRG